MNPIRCFWGSPGTGYPVTLEDLSQVWHPTQATREVADGFLEIRFVTTGLEAVKLWLYRWILHDRIIEPEELRVEVIGELRLQLRELEKAWNQASHEC